MRGALGLVLIFGGGLIAFLTLQGRPPLSPTSDAWAASSAASAASAASATSAVSAIGAGVGTLINNPTAASQLQHNGGFA